MGLIRGGRTIVEALRGSLDDIDAYAKEAHEAIIRNPRLAQDACRDIEFVTRELRRLITESLEPMLTKRDARAINDLADFAERLANVESRLAAMERDRGERAPIPITSRKHERG